MTLLHVHIFEQAKTHVIFQAETQARIFLLNWVPAPKPDEERRVEGHRVQQPVLVEGVGVGEEQAVRDAAEVD